MKRIYFVNPDPARFHGVYHEIIKHPPKGAEYVYDRKIIKEGKTGLPRRQLLFCFGKFIVNFFRLPSIYYVATKKKHDEIHSTQHIILNREPWTIDLEHAAALFGFNYKRGNSRICKFVVRKCLESKYCKGIYPWTQAAKTSLLSYINTKKIRSKIQVVYPKISKTKYRHNASEKVRLLYVAYDFYRKGGLEALLAFRKIRARCPDAEFNFVCRIPNEYRNEQQVNFLGLLSSGRLERKVFPHSDIFVYPTMHDTFGMVYLEALRHGLPVITLDDFATKEIIRNNIDGFIVKGYSLKWYSKNCLHKNDYGDYRKLRRDLSKKEQKRIVNDIAEKMLLLIKNRELRNRMSSNCLRSCFIYGN